MYIRFIELQIKIMKNNRYQTGFTIIALLASNILLAYNGIVENSFITNGISFGTALAIVISYTHNKSVLWAIIHGLFSWLYVIYFLIIRKK